MYNKINKKNINGFEINTIGNIVYLSGIAEKRKIGKIVETMQSIRHVKDVNVENIKVSDASVCNINDLALASKIKGAFIRERFFNDKIFNFDKIKVKSKNGVVTLFGRPSSYDAMKAELVARKVNGVKSISILFATEMNVIQFK